MAAVQLPLSVSPAGPANIKEIERSLWEAADQLRANSKLKSSEYSVPVLGLIFLRYADQRFAQVHEELTANAETSGRRRGLTREDYQARGVVYLPPEARFARLLQLPEGENAGKAINDAMKAVEAENDELKDVLPKSYNRLENDTLVALLRTFSSIPSIDGDAFGRIYEYFLGKFAMSEGQKGGEFFTPTSLVRLIVEIIEPYHGRIYDPACGSGGMFVQSARFVENHQRNPNAEISIFGQEKTAETVRLCRMNLAVHGLSGDIRQGNSYYEDPHNSVGRFDFVMANPPFNVDKVDKSRLDRDRRYPLGLPRADNGNYLWIQQFWSALDEHGRAGFVMANSASDARGTELEIRRRLIEARGVDVMVSIGPNFFYTVTLPCTLWFLDRGKHDTPRANQVLFIDARQTFRQIDRAHREFTPEQIEYLANIVWLYRSEPVETLHATAERATAERATAERATSAPAGDPAETFFQTSLQSTFPDGRYRDVPGLCKVATIAEIEAQNWSLNPGRYVGVTERPAEDFDFAERLEELNEELERLNAEAHELEERISGNVGKLLVGVVA